ncbi:hypothetical protein Tco_0025832 [Tanacetum coccineum]
MVSFLKKPEGSEGFHQIVDFLNSTHIKYALTENPTIYVSLIYQFWQTASASTSENGEMEITATIYWRVKTVTEASIRRHLKLEDSDGISTLPNTEIFEQLALMGNPSTSQPPTLPPSIQTTHVAEEAATMPHDSPLPRVYSLGSDEGSMTLHELMVLCTTLSKKVESLEFDLNQAKLEEGPDLLFQKIKMDAQTQGRHEHDLELDFDFTAPEEVYTAEPDISTAGVEVSTASPEVKIAAESLVYIKRSATERKDKGKAIMKEAEPLDEEERQRIAKVHKEANTFNAEEWDNIQAQIEANEELAQKLQAEEREKFSQVKKARLLVEMINELLKKIFILANRPRQ